MVIIPCEQLKVHVRADNRSFALKMMHCKDG